jgi:lipoate-protein ligase A
MQCIQLHETDPYYCLAAEEYLLKNRQDEIFMVWQSKDAVVVGKHQNALAEIDYRYIRENKISLARRISGGGTVFHDPGNVNFSIIKNFTRPDEISFRHFTEPVAAALLAMGIVTGTTGRNDLTIEGKKISGNAEHIHKNRVLHHGTLLFSSDLSRLGKAISALPGKYAGKAVMSNRSPVINIAPFLQHPSDVSQFMADLMVYFLKNNPGNSMGELSHKETEEVQVLSRQKYETTEWQFGYSPPYSFNHSFEWYGQVQHIRLQVERGSVINANLTGNVYGRLEAAKLENLLNGRPHLFEFIEKAHVELNIPYNEDLIYGYF